MNKLGAAAIVAIAAYFGAGIAPAQADDGGLCYTSEVKTQYLPTSSTVTYPQISNDTKFICLSSTTGYTIRQLAQAGWTITPPIPVATRQQSYSTGASVAWHRWQLTIQRD